MRFACFVIAILCLALVSAGDTANPTPVSPRDIGSRIIILGELGRPIGEMIAIHGTKVRASKGDQVDFAVDSVDGKSLDRSVTIQIDGIQDWPLGTKAEIRGREKGFLDFTDIRKTSLGNDDPRFELRQILYLSFDATEVANPRTLKIQRRADQKSEK